MNIGKLTCNLLGRHRSNGVITGFRNVDGAAITRCEVCDTPLVSNHIRAANPLLQSIAAGYKAEDQAALQPQNENAI